ncbi:MAG: hypothetical protein AAB890_02295 [Patescibacteria group bacterium]
MRFPFILSIILLIFVSLISQRSLGETTTPILIITWKANNYVPAFYLGKSLPIAKTKIDVALQLLDNKKLTDLSKNDIRWYVNNKLENSGIGLVNFSFASPYLGEESILLRTVVLNYKGGEWNQFLTIPIAKPEAIIDAADSSQLKPLPYFFNIPSDNKLKVDWDEDGKYVTLRIQNPTNPLEVAQSSVLKK